MGGGTESTEGVGRQEPPSASHAVGGATGVQDLDWFLLLKYLRLLYKVKFNLFPEKYFSVGQVQIVQRDFTAAQATATFAMVLILKFATLSVVK